MLITYVRGSHQDSWKSWKTLNPPVLWKFCLENLEYPWKKYEKQLEFEIFQMNFYFAKILWDYWNLESYNA